MGNNENINKLKRKLNNIYDDTRLRTAPEEWKKAAEEACSKNADDAAVQIVDFMLAHEYMPARAWRALCHAADIINKPAMLSDIYSMAAINHIIDRMGVTEPVGYADIPAPHTDARLGSIMKTAQNALLFLDRGQIYLAGKAIKELSESCPGHPDVAALQKRLEEVRCTGGVDAAGGLKPAGTAGREKLRAAADENDTAAAAERLENIISENYRCYEAYYPLGLIYLKKGNITQSDYIADVLLDLGEEASDAALLKGYILEARGQKEDAFFYFDRAYAKDRGSREAASERGRIFAEFEKDYKEYEAHTELESQKGAKDIFKNETKSAREAAAKTDQLIKNGRLIEAYYELFQGSQNEPSSELLKFKKAMALYLMRKEPEAREIFLQIAEDVPLYERALWLVEDIDRKLLDTRKFEAVKPADLADMTFGAGMYGDALGIYKKLDENELTAPRLVRKGRCEIEQGMMDAALASFESALVKDCRAAQARELSALIYQAKGENERALEMYESAMKEADGSERLRICAHKAALLYDLGMYDAVIGFAEELAAGSQPPSAADGYAGLALIKSQHPDAGRSIYYLERAIAAGASVTEFYTAAADECTAAGSYFRALINIERGLAGADEPQALYIRKCDVLYRMGRLDTAYINACMLLALQPENAEAQFIMGCIANDSGDEREALKWLKSAAELDQKNHQYVCAVANKCFKNGDTASALTYYSRALMLEPDDYGSLTKRALIYTMRDDDARAVEDIKHAMLLRSDDPELYMLLGDIFSDYELEPDLDLEDGEEASAADSSEESAEQATADDISSIEKENDHSSNDTSGAADAADTGSDNEADNEDENKDENKADSAALTRVAHEIDDASKDSEYYYSKAIELDPFCRQAYISRAGYYIKNRRLDNALDDIQKAVKLEEGDGDVYMMRGIVHHLRNENVQAINDFERASANEAYTLQALSYMAKCNNALHDYDAAVSAADRGITIDSDFLNLYVNRGVALFYLERYDEAQKDFSIVIQKKNKVNTAAVEAAYRFRGMTRDKAGDEENALKDYRMFLKYQPDQRVIRKRADELEAMLQANEKKNRFSFFKRKRP